MNPLFAAPVTSTKYDREDIMFFNEYSTKPNLPNPISLEYPYLACRYNSSCRNKNTKSTTSSNSPTSLESVNSSFKKSPVCARSDINNNKCVPVTNYETRSDADSSDDVFFPCSNLNNNKDTLIGNSSRIVSTLLLKTNLSTPKSESKTVQRKFENRVHCPIPVCHKPDESYIDKLLEYILLPHYRYNAAIDLCKHAEVVPDLGQRIWYRPGIIRVLLLEVMSLYTHVHPPTLTTQMISYLISNATLFQRIVLDSTVRPALLLSKLHLYLVPFMGMEGQTRDLEHLRISLLSFFATISHYLTSPDDLDVHLDLVTNAGDLFRNTLLALRSCFSEVGKSLAVLLLYQLLTSNQLLKLVDAHAPFTDIMCAIQYVLQFLDRLPIPNGYRHSYSREKQKQVLHYVIQILVRLCYVDRLRKGVSMTLPKELNDFSMVTRFDGDEQVVSWLNTLYSLVRPRLLARSELLCRSQSSSGISSIAS